MTLWQHCTTPFLSTARHAFGHFVFYKYPKYTSDLFSCWLIINSRKKNCHAFSFCSLNNFKDMMIVAVVAASWSESIIFHCFGDHSVVITVLQGWLVSHQSGTLPSELGCPVLEYISLESCLTFKVEGMWHGFELISGNAIWILWLLYVVSEKKKKKSLCPWCLPCTYKNWLVTEGVTVAPPNTHNSVPRKKLYSLIPKNK